ncbi:MAG: ABC transporter permease [Pirellulaceae bacterium]
MQPSRKTLGIFGLLLVICLITAIGNPQFLGSGNIENDLRRTALIGFMSIGAAIVIIAGGIDLSIGAVIALTACLFQLFLTPTLVPLKEQYLVLGVETSADISQGVTVTLEGAAHHLKQDDQLVYVVSVDGLISKGQLNVRSASVVDDGWLKTVVVLRGGSVPKGFKPGITVGVREMHHMSVVLAATLVLLISLGIGLFHGLLVTMLRLQPFVVTLCGMMIYRGLARFFANDQTLGLEDRLEDVKYLVGGKPFSIPVPLIGRISGEAPDALFGIDWIGVPVVAIMLTVTAILAILFLNYSIYGRYLMALGRNEQAARYSGINTNRMTVVAYMLCSLLAGVTGILFILEFNSVAPSSSAIAYELTAIAAAVLGGCSLRGGEGSIIGVICGAGVMQVLSNSIQMLDIPPQLEYVINGFVILLGVIADELLKRLAAKRRSQHEARLADSSPPPKDKGA